jgi:lincosamide nucleotidyltransferase A/C/D/E
MTTLGLVTGASVIEVVRELERGDLVVWLDGGWGIDALLGRETRTHSDLDLVIDRNQVPRAQQLLCRLGFEDEPDASSGWPYAISGEVGWTSILSSSTQTETGAVSTPGVPIPPAG